MIKLSIVGTVTTQFEVLLESINNSLPNKIELKQKVRIIGEEISANSESISLYSYRINQNNFQLEANFFLNIRNGLNFLFELSAELKKQEVSFVFDYCLEDSQGKSLTREKSMSYLKKIEI